MNEKLTSEQREWIHDEAWANFEYAEIDGQTRNVITLTQLDVILTAHPAEDGTCICDYLCDNTDIPTTIKNQIALWKIEEYQVENSWKFEASDWNAIHRITNYLQQEDK